MEKLESMGIKAYYMNLPLGHKDTFARRVAETIGKSTQSAQKKMLAGRLSKLEVEAISRLISSKEV
jgi:hypothetical protein